MKKIEALLRKLEIVSYFKTENIEIDLFIGGNNYYKEAGQLDLKEMNQNYTKDIISLAHKTNAFSVKINHEALESDLETLLQDKFKMNKNDYSIKMYCTSEYQRLLNEYKAEIDWFPILKQYIEYLIYVSEQFPTIEETSTWNKYKVVYDSKCNMPYKMNDFIRAGVKYSNVEFFTIPNTDSIIIECKNKPKDIEAVGIRFVKLN